MLPGSFSELVVLTQTLVSFHPNAAQVWSQRNRVPFADLKSEHSNLLLFPLQNPQHQHYHRGEHCPTGLIFFHNMHLNCLKTHGFCNNELNTAPQWGLACPAEAENIAKRANKHQILTVALKNSTPTMKIYSASVGKHAAQLKQCFSITCVHMF